MNFFRSILFCTLLLAACLTQTSFAASDGTTTYQNPNFSISLPTASHFVQKQEVTKQYGKLTNVYLYEEDIAATKNDVPMRKTILSNNPYFFAVVVPLPREVKPNEMVNVQRLFISIANGGNKQGLGLKVAEKDFLHVHQNAKEIILNGRAFQTYEIAYPKISIVYYTFIVNKQLYFFQASFLPGKQTILNNTIIQNALATLVIK